MGVTVGMSEEEVLEQPVMIPVVTAGRALGKSRDGTYDMLKNGTFPCRTVKVGRSTMVPRAELLRVLGIRVAAYGEQGGDQG